MKTRIAALITATALTTALIGAGATAAIAAGNAQNTITVDAKADPTAAAADLKLITNSTDADFIPASNPVQVSHSDWVPVGNSYTNPVNGKVENPSWNDSTSNAFGWSLGGTVSASVGSSLLGLVDEKVTVSFGVNHTWQTTDTHTENIAATSAPGQVLYLVKRTTTDDITGEYTFTAGGTHFEISNVTINVPPSSSKDQIDDTTYELEEIHLTGKPATATGAMTAAPADKSPQILKEVAKMNAEAAQAGK